MAEHPAVNRRVVGSNPTRGAKKMTSHCEVVSFFGFKVKCCGADYKILGSLSNVGVWIIKFYNTILSDIKI